MPDMRDVVSVITVVFNDVDNIEKTLKSVLEQSYNNIQFIIIDGGSTDGTLEIVKKYAHELHYWVSEKDNGIYDAMNKGLEISSGAWVNFMNSGDVFFDNNVIERTASYFSKDLSLIYGDCVFFGDDFSYVFKTKEIRRMSFLKHVLFNHQAMFFNNSVIEYYNLNYNVSSDFDLVAKLFFSHDNYKFLKINHPISICSLEGVSNNNIFESYLDRLGSLKEKSRVLYFLLCVYLPFFYIKVSILKKAKNWTLYRYYRKIKHNNYIAFDKKSNK